MTSAETSELMDVWGRVSRWPEPMKVSLASKILQSLEQRTPGPGERKSLRDIVGLWDRGQPPPSDEEVDRSQHEPRKTPADLIGAWKVGPAPSDEEVEKILEEEKMRKYG